MLKYMEQSVICYANIIVGDRWEPFFPWTLRSVVDLVDHVVICKNGEHNDPAENTNAMVVDDFRVRHRSKVTVLTANFVDFSQVRNLCLERSKKADWILRLDSDEVLYQARFASVLKHLTITKESVHLVYWFFHHFLRNLDTVHNESTLDRRYHQRFVFRSNLRWSSAVHEPLIEPTGEIVPDDRAILVNENVVAHYGYCLPDVWMFDKWQHYSCLEGRPDFYKYMAENKERCGTLDEFVKPWNILRDRKGYAFLGKHPEVIEQEKTAVKMELEKAERTIDGLHYFRDFMERYQLWEEWQSYLQRTKSAESGSTVGS